MTPRSLERIAVFAGSFNPFTIGHADIVRRGLDIFDRIIVCVGVNAAKPEDIATAETRRDHIRRLYAHESRINVECWDGLTSDFARSHGACSLLRGVRSMKDFEYERDLADANMALSGLDTVILFTDPRYGWVSSSLVRELKHHGQDVSRLLPKFNNQQ